LRRKKDGGGEEKGGQVVRGDWSIGDVIKS